jgi:ribose transport system substrate-binding protein
VPGTPAPAAPTQAPAATSAPAATTAPVPTAAVSTSTTAPTTTTTTTTTITPTAVTTATVPTAAPTAAAAAPAPGKKFTVALLQGVKGDAFYVTMEKGARTEANLLGLDLTVDGPQQFNAVQQTPIVDAMIAKKISALMIAGTDKQSMIEPMKRANDAGIPVISVDTFIGDGDYVKGPVTFPLSYIGSDNVQGGEIACNALIKSIGGKGSIYIQNVNPGISTTDQREEGCKNAIKATNGAVTLQGVDYNGDSAATSAQQTAAVLQRNPKLSAIFGCNLFSAEGAAQAVKNAGLTGVVKIANFDAPESAINDLRNKVVDVVIAQKPADIGAIAVDYAYMALHGQATALAKRVPTGYQVITLENVDTPESQAAIYKSAATPGPAPEALTKGTIALVVGVKGDAFYVTMEKGARAMATQLGVNITVDGPQQFNAVQQTPIVDAMIAKKISALMIAGTDKQSMIEPMKRANDAGIPVISVDTFIGDGDYVKGPVTFPLSYIGSDNVQGGEIACNALIKLIGGKGSIYIQNVNPGISTTDQREEGCKNAIKATNGAVTLQGVDYNGDSAATSAQQTAAVLQRNPKLSAIFGCNLFSAEGAAQAVKNAGLTGVVKIANFDAPESAINDLRNKVVDIVIAQKPADIGMDAVNAASLALQGLSAGIPKRIPTGYVVITRENVDTPEAQGAIYKSQ